MTPTFLRDQKKWMATFSAMRHVGMHNELVKFLL